MEEFVTIQTSVLPNIYPDISFVDKKYVYNRTMKIGVWSEGFITDTKFSTINDNLVISRPIQTIIYNRYELKVIAKESVDINLIKYSEYCYITLKNGTVHRANILEISEGGEVLADTQNRIFRIVYADINKDNYKDGEQPVNDFLERTNLLTQFTTQQLNNLVITADKVIDSYFCANHNNTYTFYTKLNPDFYDTEIEEESEKLVGLEKIANSKTQRIIKLRFYCHETEKNLLTKYLPRCEGEVGSTKINYNNIEYEAIERIIPDISKVEGAVDIYQCEIALKYENTNIDHYVDQDFECSGGIVIADAPTA